MKNQVKKSHLLIFYKLITELYTDVGFKGSLEVGIPEPEFQRFKDENFAFMTKCTDKATIDDYQSRKEFEFNCSQGVLTIYNKDAV